jgi:hypothetical protein
MPSASSTLTAPNRVALTLISLKSLPARRRIPFFKYAIRSQTILVLRNRWRQLGRRRLPFTADQLMPERSLRGYFPAKMVTCLADASSCCSCFG